MEDLCNNLQGVRYGDADRARGQGAHIYGMGCANIQSCIDRDNLGIVTFRHHLGVCCNRKAMEHCYLAITVGYEMHVHAVLHVNKIASVCKSECKQYRALLYVILLVE